MPRRGGEDEQGKQDESKHPHVTSGPKGGQFTSTKGGSGPAKRPQTAPKKTPAKQQVVTAPPAPKGRQPDLKAGGKNDPARVKQLQALIHDLRLAPLNVDGQFGSDTEAAVKAIQAKLGMKPTGRASTALIKRLTDAHKLSPCIGKPVAASALVVEAPAEPDEIDDEDGLDPELVSSTTVGRLDMTRWSDDTVWLGDQIELDLDDAAAVARGDVPEWLTRADEDGLVLTADDARVEILPALVDEFRGQLSTLLGEPVAAALGHDTTPGHDELHHYWVHGAGAAQWVEAETPWTTLVALLTKHVGPEKARIYASRWFIERFGFAAGSDKNRVAHGHPPRGHLVGPG